MTAGRTSGRRAFQVVDLGFGDAGKGTIVDALVRRHDDARLVVRFNGGPQAGHNVVTDDGRHHTFAQFGAGTFVEGCRTLLSRHVLIEPFAMLNEARHLTSLGVGDAFDQLLIDARCRVISPVQQVANRLRERSRGPAAHGTCGMGVGECVGDSITAPELTIRAADLRDAARLRRLFLAHLDRKRAELRHVLASGDRDRLTPLLEVFERPDAWIDGALDAYREVASRATITGDVARAIEASSTLVFEGAQGVLLDERHGFHPHTTWSDTTFTNADAVLDEADFESERTRIGVTRCYATRHGAGPFVTESELLTAKLDEPHNGAGGWQGGFRVGHFDAVAFRYALACVGRIDGLAVTHLDRIAKAGFNVCERYLAATSHPRAVLDEAGNVESLRPGPAEDESLTEMLCDVRPGYWAYPDASAAAFVAYAARLAGVPVAIESFGPAAADKRFTPSALLP